MVTRRALLSAGFSPKEIEGRLLRGTLIRVHRGVYRVGHLAPSLEATNLAAVWACGDGALLCGAAAAHAFGLIDWRPATPEVLTPTERRVRGIRTRRCRALGTEDRTIRDRVPITSVPRTLVDMAGRLSVDALATACHRAGGLHRATPRHVAAVFGRYPNPPGRARLVFVMSGGAPVSLSKLESRFLRRLREAKLALPDQTNKYADEHRVDCRWIGRRLTVELDSYRWHNSMRSWQKDRDRERAAYARGDQHRRYTWADVAHEPRAMLAELSSLLG